MRTKLLKVYTVIERPGKQSAIWLEIGTATEGADGHVQMKPKQKAVVDPPDTEGGV